MIFRESDASGSYLVLKVGRFFVVLGRWSG